MLKKKNTLFFFLQISLYLFPISLIVGSLLVNINVIIFIFLAVSYLLLNKLKIYFNHINLSLLLFFITLIFSSFLNIEEAENLSYKEKIILSLLLLNFLIELFPLKSTGSLFTTWNGTLLWLSISLVNYKNLKR